MFGALLGGVVDDAEAAAEEQSPGAGDGDTVTGNILSDDGVLDDAATNLASNDATGLVMDSYDNTFAEGGVIENLSTGGGTGAEGAVENGAGEANDTAPDLSDETAAADEVFDTADSEVAFAEGAADGVSEGAGDGDTLLGNVLSDDGVADDAVANGDEADLGGLLVDSWNNLFAPGGVIENLAEGGGTGLEGAVEGATEAEQVDADIEQADDTFAQLDYTVSDVDELLDGLSNGAGDGSTLLGNLLSEKGVLDDIITQLDEGDVGGAISATYTNLFAPGGVIENLGEGGGTGLEGLLESTFG